MRRWARRLSNLGGAMKLDENWRSILRRAWSVRIALALAVVSGMNAALPVLADVLPRGVFAVLTFGGAVAIVVARLVYQKDV